MSRSFVVIDAKDAVMLFSSSFPSPICCAQSSSFSQRHGAIDTARYRKPCYSGVVSRHRVVYTVLLLYTVQYSAYITIHILLWPERVSCALLAPCLSFPHSSTAHTASCLCGVLLSALFEAYRQRARPPSRDVKVCTVLVLVCESS